MLADIVPEVAVEDLKALIALAIERNLLSWEQVAIACVQYAQKKDDHLAAALACAWSHSATCSRRVLRGYWRVS